MERFLKLGSNGYVELFIDGKASPELLVGAGIKENNRYVFSSFHLLCMEKVGCSRLSLTPAARTLEGWEGEIGVLF